MTQTSCCCFLVVVERREQQEVRVIQLLTYFLYKFEMFSSSSNQKRKRERVSLSASSSSSFNKQQVDHQQQQQEADTSSLLLRPNGKIHNLQEVITGRVYRNGDFLCIKDDQFLLYRDVLHTLKPICNQFTSSSIMNDNDNLLYNFQHEVCYAVDSQGERTIIVCSKNGKVFFASPIGGIYAQSQLECCIDKSDEVSTICAISKSFCYYIFHLVIDWITCMCIFVIIS